MVLNEASTINIYVRAVRLLGVKIGKSPENIVQDELHKYLLEVKGCTAFDTPLSNKALKARTRPAVPAFNAQLRDIIFVQIHRQQESLIL